MTNAQAIIDLVYDAIKFADFAAGEGFFDPDNHLDPSDFLFEFCNKAGIEDTETVAEQVRDHLTAALIKGDNQ